MQHGGELSQQQTHFPSLQDQEWRTLAINAVRAGKAGQARAREAVRGGRDVVAHRVAAAREGVARVDRLSLAVVLQRHRRKDLAGFLVWVCFLLLLRNEADRRGVHLAVGAAADAGERLARVVGCGGRARIRVLGK